MVKGATKKLLCPVSEDSSRSALQSTCAELGLAVSGTKPQLCDRIRKHVTQRPKTTLCAPPKCIVYDE